MTDELDAVSEEASEAAEEKSKAAQYYAFVSKEGEVTPPFVTAKTWAELNDTVEQNGYTVHKILKGREIGFCTKLVIAPTKGA